MKPHENLDPLVIGGKSYYSRLLTQWNPQACAAVGA